ncbi:hypothetical protein [Parabacteroides distasonis]|uniref:hypothetical protein n=1 Tax=Parabacteroides distasonis TaxID=823 RepID=UPI0012497747|nr:hypothetical protein [Parabacteroides distasonis]
MEQEKFDLWCVVELFGHSRIAGRCTEQNVAGTNMLRVDVPDTSNQPGFTRFLSSGAIYAKSCLRGSCKANSGEPANTTCKHMGRKTPCRPKTKVPAGRRVSGF